jgi:hypothetical protein
MGRSKTSFPIGRETFVKHNWTTASNLTHPVPDGKVSQGAWRGSGNGLPCDDLSRRPLGSSPKGQTVFAMAYGELLDPSWVHVPIESLESMNYKQRVLRSGMCAGGLTLFVQRFTVFGHG